MFSGALTTGIEISEGEWRIVQVARAAGGITVRQRHVVRFGPLPFETDLRVAARAEALKAYLKKNKLSISAARLCISKGAVAARYRRMPPTDTSAELRQMARFEAERHIPFHSDRHIYDYLLMEQQALAGNDVMTVAVDEPVIQEALAVCQAAGIDAASADVSSLALYRLFRMRERPKAPSEMATAAATPPTIALMHLGPGNLDVVIIHKGVALFTRCANVGVNHLIEALGDEAPLDIADLDIAAAMEDSASDAPSASVPGAAHPESPDPAATEPAAFTVSDDLGDMPRLPGVLPAEPAVPHHQETFDLDADPEPTPAPAPPAAGGETRAADPAASSASVSQNISVFSRRAISRPAPARSPLLGHPAAVGAPGERPAAQDAPATPASVSAPAMVPPPTMAPAPTRPAGFAPFTRSAARPTSRLSPEGRAAAQQWLNRVLTEVGRAYDFAYREYGCPGVTTILVSGLGARIGGFQQHLAGALRVEVEPLMQGVKPPVREKLGRKQPAGLPLESDAIAIGAALDNPPDLGPSVNLMPEWFLRKRRRRSQMASMMTSVTLVVCALALGGFYLYQVNRVKAVELDELRNAQLRYGPLVREIEKMEQEIEIFDEFRNPQKNALHILNYIAGLPITQNNIKIIQFEFVQGRDLKMQGHATNLSDINQLRDTLDRSGYFYGVAILNHQQITLPRRGSAQVWDFSITCLLEDPDRRRRR